MLKLFFLDFSFPPPLSVQIIRLSRVMPALNCPSLLVCLSSYLMWMSFTVTFRFLKMLAISFWTKLSPPSSFWSISLFLCLASSIRAILDIFASCSAVSSFSLSYPTLVVGTNNMNRPLMSMLVASL